MRKVFFVLILSLVCSSLLAKEHKESIVDQRGLCGDAGSKGTLIYKYSTYTKDYREIVNGAISATLDVSESNGFAHRKIIGTMKDDKRAGAWTSSYDAQLKGSRGVVKEKFVSTGNYANGIPTGKWSMDYAWSLQGQLIGKVLCTATFKDTVIRTIDFQGKNCNNDTHTIKGSCDENGYCDGEWVDVDVYIKKMTFNHGILIKEKVTKKSTGEVVTDTVYAIDGPMYLYSEESRVFQEISEATLYGIDDNTGFWGLQDFPSILNVDVWNVYNSYSKTIGGANHGNIKGFYTKRLIPKKIIDVDDYIAMQYIDSLRSLVHARYNWNYTISSFLPDVDNTKGFSNEEKKEIYKKVLSFCEQSKRSISNCTLSEDSLYYLVDNNLLKNDLESFDSIAGVVNSKVDSLENLIRINEEYQTCLQRLNNTEDQIRANARYQQIRDSHLSVYNKINWADLQPDTESLAVMGEYLKYQQILVDSVLSQVLLDKIDCGKDQILSRSGNEYKDVSDAYLVEYKQIKRKPQYNDYSSFYLYKQGLTEAYCKQQAYNSLLDKRINQASQISKINANKVQINEECGKVYKDIATSYKTVCATYDLMRKPLTSEECDKYSQYLSKTIEQQQELMKFIEVRKKIDENSTQILAQSKSYKFLAKAYAKVMDTFDKSWSEDRTHKFLTTIVEFQEKVVLNMGNIGSQINDELKNVKEVEQMKNILVK